MTIKIVPSVDDKAFMVMIKIVCSDDKDCIDSD